MRIKTMVICAAVMGVIGFAATSAMGAAPSTVTINVNHNPHYFKGFVSSPKPRKCAEHRLVKVFRQKGSEQRPKRDNVVVKDRAEATQTGLYRWLVNRYQPSRGKYYARIHRIRGCKADNSRTIRVSAQSK